jgi:hypothetical protein
MLKLFLVFLVAFIFSVLAASAAAGGQYLP